MTPEQALEVYKIQHSRFEKTREIQWKFNLATWTLLVLAISFSEKMANMCPCLIWILSVAYIISHAIFVYRTQDNLGLNKAIWSDILEKLNPVTSATQPPIQIDIPDIKKKPRWKSTDTYWLIFQMIVTLILIIIFIALYYHYHNQL